MFRSFFYRVVVIGFLLNALSGCGGTTTDTGFNASDLNTDTNTTTYTDTGGTSSANKTGVVTLNWIPPTENSDGSTLVDLSGYNIYYGQSPDLLNNSISLNTAGLTSYVIENLDANTTYYFAITARNSQNSESGLSNIVSKLTSS